MRLNDTDTGLPEGMPRARSWATAASKPVRAARCIAAPARRSRDRRIIARSRFMRSSPGSTSRPSLLRSLRARGCRSVSPGSRLHLILLI